MKSKSAAALLAVFVGGLGIHKFYLNRPLQGILYVLFFWTWVPMILGLADGVRFALMSDSEFNRLYNDGYPAVESVHAA